MPTTKLIGLGQLSSPSSAVRSRSVDEFSRTRGRPVITSEYRSDRDRRAKQPSGRGQRGTGPGRRSAARRCRGWTVGDLIVHVYLGLQDMLLGLVAPTDAEPDTGAATYWRAEFANERP